MSLTILGCVCAWSPWSRSERRRNCLFWAAMVLWASAVRALCGIVPSVSAGEGGSATHTPTSVDMIFGSALA